MIIRFLFLLLFSNAVFSSGVTIELDCTLTCGIGTIVYDPGWENIEDVDGLASLGWRSFPHADVRMGLFQELGNLDLSILYKSDNLNQYIISEYGSKEEIAYPLIENDFTAYTALNGIPYILDETNNTIWQWSVDYWKDLNDMISLPESNFGALATSGDQLLLSGEGEDNTGLWEVGLTVNKVSDVAWPSESALHSIKGGVIQTHKNDSNQYILHWLNDAHDDLVSEIDATVYPNVYSYPSETGVILSFYGDAGFQLVWIASSGSEIESLTLPESWRLFKGCFTSYPRVFCAMSMDEVSVSLYEVTNGEFILDSKLNSDSELLNGNITNIYAAGSQRWVSVKTSNENSNTFTLYRADENGIEAVIGGETESLDDYYYIYQSQKDGVFYWVGNEMGSTNIFKASLSGDLTFKRNITSEIEEALVIAEEEKIAAEQALAAAAEEKLVAEQAQTAAEEDKLAAEQAQAAAEEALAVAEARKLEAESAQEKAEREAKGAKETFAGSLSFYILLLIPLLLIRKKHPAKLS